MFVDLPRRHDEAAELIMIPIPIAVVVPARQQPRSAPMIARPVSGLGYSNPKDLSDRYVGHCGFLS